MIIKISFLFATIGGALAVVLGAFGSHCLRGRIEERLLETFQTAVEYQMYHCLVLMMVAVLMREWGSSVALEIASSAFILGVLLFSGSLYGLVLMHMKWLGPVTPVGGLCLIVGWIALVYSGFQSID